MQHIRIIKLICTALLAGSFSPAMGTGWRVCPACDQHSLVETIQRAAPGDTIWVDGGYYAEGKILIEKSLYLMGINQPTLDGKDKTEVLSIKGEDIHVSGFRVVNSGVSSLEDMAGIGVEYAARICIEDNVLENTFFGIHLYRANHCTIRRNRLTAAVRPEYNTGNGIHLLYCNNALIKDNEISRHRDGIYFEFVTESVIQNNLSHDNQRYGLHFMFSHHDRYEGNQFYNNGSGVAVMYSHHVEMHCNRFEQNWGGATYGLLLKDIRDSQVQYNTFDRNTTAIYMEGCSRSHFLNNDFSRNGYGVKLQASCDDNIFERNNFSGNTFDMSTNGSTVLNTLAGNYWDKYEGYDLGRDGIGDIPYRPVSLYAMMLERIPHAVLLLRSFTAYLLDKMEKVMPGLTPENLLDDRPLMKPVIHDPDPRTV